MKMVLFDKRFASDYQDFFEPEKETVKELLANAENLVKTIEAMLTVDKPE